MVMLIKLLSKRQRARTRNALIFDVFHDIIERKNSTVFFIDLFVCSFLEGLNLGKAPPQNNSRYFFEQKSGHTNDFQKKNILIFYFFVG